MKALNRRGTKSVRRPILVKVTTPLTTKTMSALIMTGKIWPCLPSLPLGHAVINRAPCDLNRKSRAVKTGLIWQGILILNGIPAGER